jgi:hypothetical protein
MAQHLYVFQRLAEGSLALLYDWPVSTGRETSELDVHGHIQSTSTPTGYYELDSRRFYVQHKSGQWEEPMPYAMFFDWNTGGRPTGVAIHGTANTTALGTRASAGCVRLSPGHARILFDLIRSGFGAYVPKLAIHESKMEVAREDPFVRAANGTLMLEPGYSVLVVVDDQEQETRMSSR